MLPNDFQCVDVYVYVCVCIHTTLLLKSITKQSRRTWPSVLSQEDKTGDLVLHHAVATRAKEAHEVNDPGYTAWLEALKYTFFM